MPSGFNLAGREPSFNLVKGITHSQHTAGLLALWPYYPLSNRLPAWRCSVIRRTGCGKKDPTGIWHFERAASGASRLGAPAQSARVGWRHLRIKRPMAEKMTVFFAERKGMNGRAALPGADRVRAVVEPAASPTGFVCKSAVMLTSM